MCINSRNLILLIGLITLSFQLNLKQNSNATTLSNSSDIPKSQNSTSTGRNESLLKPTDPPQEHPVIEPPKPPENNKEKNNTNTTSTNANSTHSPTPPTSHPVDKPHPVDIPQTHPIPPTSLMKPQPQSINSTNNKTTKNNTEITPNPLPPPKPSACNRNLNPKSTLYFNLYDVLIHVQVNGKDISQQISKKEASDWAKTHSFSFGLCEGDVIQIAGKNTLGYLIGMIGTLHFKNQKGVEKIYNTGASWICDGKPATVKGVNGSVKGWNKLSLIDSKAQFIWNDKPTQKGAEVYCDFKVPMN